ncbi:SDR family NAD(P)-dependent oxidoreductase [Telmatospirillum sp. J64-1]|uniref:SDR family NAD(P)-dependent oxidoreductase n=1 Tax=Telmatospirillum sp. J64-1 TaxID=2502183 RepID=UPI00115D426C|nr:SDR family NAD(P)-dependent oxidoreductase [Telmatospirillum sp. J64-1]
MDRSGYGAALVTGGGSGIGRQCALTLAHRGAKILVTDLNAEAADRVAEEIRGLGGAAEAMAMDVTDPSQVEAAFSRAEALWDGVDILVNSAGLIIVEPLLDFRLETFEKVMSVNVAGSFLTGQRAARTMARRGYGRIVNLSSVSGQRAGVGRAAYGTSKAAIIGLTRQFALELGPLGITANAVAPGVIETPMTLNAYSQETWEKVLGMVPTGRRGRPEDIAEAVAYLASPHASYVNGEVLTVDGGYMATGMTQTGSIALRR